MSRTRLAHAAALLLAASAFAPLAGLSATTPTLAADDDLYCWIVILPDGSEDVECDTVGNLKAFCKLADPNSKSEECQDVGRMFVPPVGLTADSSDSGGDGTSGPRTPSGIGLTIGARPN